MIMYDDLEPTEKIKVYDKGITVNDFRGNRAAVEKRPTEPAICGLRICRRKRLC